MPINVFLASDPRDQRLRDEFITHLGNLRQRKIITIWCDDHMLAGSSQEKERLEHLDKAQIILLLLSANFMDSELCADLQARALARSAAHQATVIPILLSPTDYKGAAFEGLLILPRNGKAVTEWPTHDAALSAIVEDLHQTIDALQASTPLITQAPDAPQPTLWRVPPRNPYFTGRDGLLAQLNETLTTTRTVALTQAVAISGLGGIGKTQTDLEYAHRYRESYQHIFWVKAETEQELLSDLASLAQPLQLPEQHIQEQALMVQAVKRWLATNANWLLILDNADDLTIVHAYLPQDGKGHLLLTTRAHSTRGIACKVEVSKMSAEEGLLFLLRRAGIINEKATPETAPEPERQAAAELVNEVDGLPLALDQAGAYIDEMDYSISRYLPLYRKERTRLLQRRGGLNPDHPASVATTWSLSFAKVGAVNPAAADLLRFCSFLAPEAIPEEILTKGVSYLGPRLQPVADDPLALNEAISELLTYSLVSRDAPSQTLTVHRLVQAVLRDSMNKKVQRGWAERAVKAVGAAFQFEGHEIWSLGKRFFPHAQACTALVEQWAFDFAEVARLLNQAAYYLDTCLASYRGALPLLQQALAIREQVLGPQHPHTAVSLNNLALLYEKLGQYKQALPLLHRALVIREQVLGPQHPHTATSFNNLAMLYEKLGQYEDALPLCQRALAIAEKVIPHHPNTVTARNSYARLLQKMQQEEQS